MSSLTGGKADVHRAYPGEEVEEDLLRVIHDEHDAHLLLRRKTKRGVSSFIIVVANGPVRVSLLDGIRHLLHKLITLLVEAEVVNCARVNHFTVTNEFILHRSSCIVHVQIFTKHGDFLFQHSFGTSRRAVENMLGQAVADGLAFQ